MAFVAVFDRFFKEGGVETAVKRMGKGWDKKRVAGAALYLWRGSQEALREECTFEEIQIWMGERTRRETISTIQALIACKLLRIDGIEDVVSANESSSKDALERLRSVLEASLDAQEKMIFRVRGNSSAVKRLREQRSRCKGISKDFDGQEEVKEIVEKSTTPRKQIYVRQQTTDNRSKLNTLVREYTHAPSTCPLTLPVVDEKPDREIVKKPRVKKPPFTEADQAVAKELMDFWNAEAEGLWPLWEQLNPRRVIKVRKYFKEQPDMAYWRALILKAKASEFLRQNDKHWFTLDWILQEGKDGQQNHEKVASGRYDDRKTLPFKRPERDPNAGMARHAERQLMPLAIPGKQTPAGAW